MLGVSLVDYNSNFSVESIVLMVVFVLLLGAFLGILLTVFFPKKK